VSAPPTVRRTRHHYGAHHSQVADLYRPLVQGPLPVVVLYHGGFWRAVYTKILMKKLAVALAERGLAAWNVEYRRVGPGGGGGGWPATLADAGAALDHLATVAGVDPERVVTLGHSAGGQLALFAAGRHRLGSDTPFASPVVRPRGAVSLAGVVDLERSAELGLGGGAAEGLLGGGPAEVPDRYPVASPAALVPLGLPQLLVHGLDDTVVPPSMSERYARRAHDAGDDVRLVTLEGVGHREVIDPRAESWPAVVDFVGELIS